MPNHYRGQFITSSNRETIAKSRIELERERIEEAAAEGRKVFLTADGGRGEFVKLTRTVDHDLAAFNHKHASIIAEMARRLETLRAQLDNVKARVKK